MGREEHWILYQDTQQWCVSGHISAKNKKTETKRKLKAFGDALKFPQSTNRGGKEERATVTPEKKQLEWQNSELLKLEVAAAERPVRQIERGGNGSSSKKEG